MGSYEDNPNDKRLFWQMLSYMPRIRSSVCEAHLIYQWRWSGLRERRSPGQPPGFLEGLTEQHGDHGSTRRDEEDESKGAESGERKEKVQEDENTSNSPRGCHHDAESKQLETLTLIAGQPLWERGPVGGLLCPCTHTNSHQDCNKLGINAFAKRKKLINPSIAWINLRASGNATTCFV